MVILTKGSREIDVHDIDDVIINHEPTTYDTKKQIFSCRYCNHMYQSPIWLAQHENECDLRADSEFKKIMHPTVNTIPTEESEIPTSNFSPENDSEIELEPSSPMFYMPTHNHIDAYQTNHPENQYNNNDHQIYPHQDETYDETTVTNEPNIDANEIILEPMDSQPIEITEPPTPIQASPPSSSGKQLSNSPIPDGENHAQENNSIDVPKLKPIKNDVDVLKDDEDSIVIYQDHQDSQETKSSNDEEEMAFIDMDKHSENEQSESDMSEGDETESEDDSESETVSG